MQDNAHESTTNGEVISSLAFINNNMHSLGSAITKMTQGVYGLLDSQRVHFRTQQDSHKEQVLSRLDTND